MIVNNMKCFVCEDKGGPTVLKLGERTLPVNLYFSSFNI